jgi:DNA polymerase III subunit epsilon
MTASAADAPGRQRTATVRYLLALSGLSLVVLAGAALAGVVVWDGMDAEARAAAQQAAQDGWARLGLIAVVTVLAVAAALTVPFRRYVLPALRLEEEGRLMLEVDTPHRVDPGSADALHRIAGLLNEFADRHQSLRLEVDARVARAGTALTAERDRLAAIVAQLPQGLLLCNTEGRIVLYNPRARLLAGDGDERFIGLNRSVHALIDRPTLERALDEVRRARAGGADTPAVSFETSVDQLAVRVHLATVESVGAGDEEGFILLLDPITDRVPAVVEPLGERVAIGDLLLALRAQLSTRLGVEVAVAVPDHPFWLRVDSPLLTRAVADAVARGHGRTIHDVRVSAAGVEGFAHLDVAWRGSPTTPAALGHLVREPLPGRDGVSTSTLAHVVEAHLGEVLTEHTADRATLRLLLPIGDPGASPPVAPLARELSQYDFRLLAATDRSSDLDDRPVAALSCTVFDTETTGLRPREGDEIVSIGAVRIVEGRLRDDERFSRLVDPCRSVPEASVRIHGLTRELLDGRPLLADVVPAFARFCADTVLVGHNIAFDLRFLEEAAPRTGIRLAQPILDTLLLSAIAHPQQRDHSLEAVAARLGVDVVGRHTAFGDALVTAQVFLRLLPLLAARGIVTLGEARAASQATRFAAITY